MLRPGGQASVVLDRHASVSMLVASCGVIILPYLRQNNVEELYSLLKFLRVKPLNDWQTFNEQINKPVKSGRSVRAMKRLHVCTFLLLSSRE